MSAKYATAIDPATRTKGAVAAKNSAKQAMKDAVKSIVRVIYAQNLSDQQLIDIGLRPYDSVATPWPIPDSAPVLEVKSVFGRQMKVRLKPEIVTLRAPEARPIYPAWSRPRPRCRCSAYPCSPRRSTAWIHC